jgi:H+/gluconate symporter-like permease
MIGNIGVFVGLGLLIVLALRGVNILIASLVSAMVVAVTNSDSIAQVLTGDYVPGMMDFAGKYFMLFLTGAVFGGVMGESKAAASIADKLSKKLGDDRALLIIVAACAILTYGGVNVFIVVFTLYPLGLNLLRSANLPKRLFVCAKVIGAGTFTMTALPGSPSIHNNIAAEELGTSLVAAPWLGILGAVIMCGLGVAYLEWQRKVAIRRNEGFVPGPNDVFPATEEEQANMPPWLRSSVPLLAVLATILVPLWIGRLMQLPAAASGETTSAFKSLLMFARDEPSTWTCIALVVGTVIALLLFRPHVTSARDTLGRGAASCALPLLNTAAVIGFGAVVRTTAVFDTFANLMLHSRFPPLVSAVISINVISGIVASASGGLSIWMSSLAQHFLDAGVPPEVLHRVVTMAAGGLDTLPHCGAVITTFTIVGVTHREAYKDVAMVSVVIPIVAVIVVLAAALWFG